MKNPPWFSKTCSDKVSQNQDMIDPFMGYSGGSSDSSFGNNIGGLKNQLEMLISQAEKILLDGRDVVPGIQVEMEQAIHKLKGVMNRCVDIMANKPSGGSL